METLAGLNWLNDEVSGFFVSLLRFQNNLNLISVKQIDVHFLLILQQIINFYMELLKERGTLDNYPKVHAFNTFFYPKITSGGHSAVKRWTRRVDVFAVDYILIPVHLGMHWCLAVSSKNWKFIILPGYFALRHLFLFSLMESECIKTLFSKSVIFLGGRLSKETNKVLRFYGRQK